MWSKIKGRRPMMTAQSEADLIRPQIVAAVAKLRSRGLSQMDAYAALGREVEKSPTWIRRIIGRSPDVAIRLRDAFNVSAAYERLCSAVTAAADAQAAENNRLREEINAALLHRDQAVRLRTPGGAPAAGAAARRSGRPSASALVRPLPAPGVSAAADEDLTDLPLWRVANGEE